MRFTTVVCFIAILLSGCASTSDGTRQSDGTKSIHRVEEHKSHVVIPATADTPAQIVPVVDTVEIWEDEQSHSSEQSHNVGSSGPDMKQIAPVVAALGSTAVAVGTGGGSNLLPTITGLITAAAVGWAALKGGQAAEKDRQIAFHQKDADEAYKRLLPPVA